MGIYLTKKKLSNGRISLYLDYRIENQRHKECLGIILEKEETKEQRLTNKLKLNQAKLIRLQREMNYLHTQYLNQLSTFLALPTPEFPLNYRNFFDIAQEYLNNYRQKDSRTVQAVFYHLQLFCKGKHLHPDDITTDFCNKFFDYLYDHLHGNTPANYFKKFKMCLNYCVEKQIIPENPTNNMHITQYNDITKNILSNEEINRLALTPCKNQELKRAFLFACYSGLRWCDIKQLRYKDVDFTTRKITIIQKKVARHSQNAVLHLNLNESALQLLQLSSGNSNDTIFQLPSHSYCLRVLNKWTKQANIKKHISFHCARHTFITHIMEKGANIKTAASLAGHSTTRHTEKYIHIIDEQKQKAVDSLPPLPTQFT